MTCSASKNALRARTVRDDTSSVGFTVRAPHLRRAFTVLRSHGHGGPADPGPSTRPGALRRSTRLARSSTSAARIRSVDVRGSGSSVAFGRLSRSRRGRDALWPSYIVGKDRDDLHWVL